MVIGNIDDWVSPLEEECINERAPYGGQFNFSSSREAIADGGSSFTQQVDSRAKKIPKNDTSICFIEQSSTVFNADRKPVLTKTVHIIGNPPYAYGFCIQNYDSDGNSDAIWKWGYPLVDSNGNATTSGPIELSLKGDSTINRGTVIEHLLRTADQLPSTFCPEELSNRDLKHDPKLTGSLIGIDIVLPIFRFEEGNLDEIEFTRDEIQRGIH